MLISEILSYYLPRQTVGILGDKYICSTLSVCMLAAYVVYLSLPRVTGD